MQYLEKIKHNLSDLSKKNILVVGDIMLDEYHWCSVDRISPEAPVPICKVEKTSLVPGGASNVASNIVALGSTSYLCGVIGNDSSGEKLLSVLNNHRITTDYIYQSRSKPTILKSRIVAKQQHIVRVDRENTTEISPEVESKLASLIESNLSSFNAILLSDYLKGTLTPSFIKTLINMAKTAGVPLIIDPKGDDYSKYQGATLLTPNFKEFCAVIKKIPQTEDEIFSEGLTLIKDLHLDALLVTRSEHGMSLITPTEKIDIPTEAKEVYDITGAGDTVISVLTLALSAGWTFEEAARVSNVAAGIVVGKIGTSTTSLDEIGSKVC